MRRFVAMLAVTVAAGAGLTLATSSAQASCAATIRVSNVSVTSTNLYNVKGAMNSCAATASWDMDGGSGYSQTVSSWIFSSTHHTDYAYYFPGIDPLGSYKAAGTGAYDGSFNPLPQTNAAFAIKLGSRISLSGYRSGSYVYLRAHVTRFNPSLNYGLGGWQVSTNRYVTFYDLRSTGWHLDGYKYTSSNGTTPYLRIYQPGHHYFLAKVGQTATIWNATSGKPYL
jgi:hypothetical protein